MIQKTKKTQGNKNLHKQVRIELSETEINKRIDQIESMDIDDEFRDFLVSALEALVILDKLVGMKDTTIKRLREMFNKTSEKRKNNDGKDKTESDSSGKHPRGNNKGKNGKDEYPNAPKVEHKHEHLKAGQTCPACQTGKINEYQSGVYIRITGSPPISAVIHNTEKLRCNTCGEIFEAEFEGKNAPKYDSRAIAIIALLKFSASMPYYRLDKIQKHLKTPMPASTQWDLMDTLANYLYPVWQSLLKTAANGNKFFIDDTKVKVLSLIKENKHLVKKDRKGMFTTGLISEGDFGRIVLYLSGRNHAGENLDKIIKTRTSKEKANLMSDALAANDKSDFEFARSYCLSHGRRKFVTVDDVELVNPCQYVLDCIGEVYKNEKYCRESKLSPKDRLIYHQTHSTNPMSDLESWCRENVENNGQDSEIEPNSPLYTEIMYLLNHWEGLTSFLRIEGASLDNNIAERILRLQVINRKNSLFYKTEHGALVGDIICSILKTSEEAKINPFEYLVWVQENAAEVKINPEKFMPWSFKQK